MHILLIHQAFTSLDEAGGTRHAEMALFLAQRGHRVTIITSPVSYLTGKAPQTRTPWVSKENLSPGINIIRSYTLPALHRSFVHRVLSFFSFMASSFWVGLQVKNVDLVWGTSPPIFQGFTAWLLARLKRVPFQFEVRDLWPAFAIAMGVLKNPLLVSASLRLERFLYTHADWIIVNSPGFIPHLQSRGAKNIHLVPNGVDIEMFSPIVDGSKYRTENGLQEKFIVLYAGAHGLSNDLDVVLDAAEILKDHDEIRFVLVGDGKEKPALQAAALRRGLDNVIFLPPVPKTGMGAVLAASDCCIAILKPVDLYKTTYPNKVFDYMATAKPVVLAIDGVIRDVVDKAQAGLFSSPGKAPEMAQAVLHLASDRVQSEQMGLRGRQLVEKEFDRNAISSRYVDFLEARMKQYAWEK